MKNNEWTALANLLRDLILKYADVLDLDSMPEPPRIEDNTLLAENKRQKTSKSERNEVRNIK